MVRTTSRARSGVRTGRSGLVPVLASSPDGETNSTVGGLAAAAGPAARTGPSAVASTATTASTGRRNERRSDMTVAPRIDTSRQDIGCVPFGRYGPVVHAVNDGCRLIGAAVGMEVGAGFVLRPVEVPADFCAGPPPRDEAPPGRAGAGVWGVGGGDLDDVAG